METTTRNISVQKITKVAEVLKAIGHPVRLQILGVLEQEEPLSVSDIQSRIEIATEQSLLSHHLIKLKDKGILKCEKNGMNMMYRIADRHVLGIFDCMDQCHMF